MDPWCRSHHIFGVAESEDYAVAIDMPIGEEKDVVIRGIVDQLNAIYDVLQSAESEHE